MEEVINKSDGQFKDILDDLVDYSKHSSKKDPLIKELSRPKSNNTKPPASINSSTYSSAASSASDSSTHSSSSSSSTSSASSSKSSSPSQGQLGNTQNGKNQADYNGIGGGGMVEMAKMEDLGKTAKILEHRLPPVLRTVPIVVATSNPQYVSHYPLNSNKKYNIEEYDAINNSNGSNDTNNDKESGPNLNLNLTAQKYASNNSTDDQLNVNGVATTSGAITSSTAASSWKTFNAKRDKRRKKPVERKILAKEIPGHRGDQTVEELTKFIESGTNGTSNNGHNNKINKNKPQSSSNGTPNNSNQLNIGSSNNNTSTNTINNNTINNNSNTSTNNSINISTNNSIKKNESHQINTKPPQTSTKMTNNVQPKSPPQPMQPNQNQQQPTMPQNSQPTQPKQQIAQVEQTREIQSQRSTNKPLQQAPPPLQPKHAPNHTMRQTQRRIQQTIVGQPSLQQPVQQQQPPQQQQQQQPPQQQQQQLPQQQQQLPQQQTLIQKQTNKFQQTQEAVTFAEHIPVRDDDVIRQYKFGFFDDQEDSQKQQTKPININHNSHVNSTRKQTSQPLKNEQKQKLKQSKASPISEENCYKSNDNIDSPSFNYDQILKFISNAWESTQAQVATASQNH